MPQPSLQALRDYYLTQAENDAVSATERDLWRRLAHELDAHLDPGADEAQEGLW